MSRPSAMPDPVLEQAILWAVRMQSGTVDDSERSACAHWRAAHPAHEQAWQQVQTVEQVFRNATPSGHLAYAVLQGAGAQRPLLGRRGLLKAMGIGAIGLALGGIAANWQQRARYATTIGERRDALLADGSRLLLNTGSTAEVVLSPLRRLVELRRGEVLIETGADRDALAGPRPFWVETIDARLESLGARFAVRQLTGSTRLHVERGSVHIHAAGGPPMLAKAGENIAIAAGSAPAPLPDSGFDATAWADGALIARQMRLDVFVAELARYRDAPLYCDPAAATLRISGVFQLDGRDPAERVLAVLVRTLPVRLRRGAGGSVTLVAA